MNISRINLNEEYHCGGNGTLTLYSTSFDKPLILVCPGGAYTHLSTRESYPVVNKFISLGYDCALLMYSVAPLSYPVQLNEVNASIKHLSAYYKNIFILGFSAGGHLAGIGGTDIYSSLIKGMILCYPVISFENQYTHELSRHSFLGEAYDKKENYSKYSIDQRVNKNTPSTFIWCNATDESVNHNNTYLMVEALRKNNVYYEFKEFDHGCHGMALADVTATSDNHLNCYDEEIAQWPELANNFIRRVLNYGK